LEANALAAAMALIFLLVGPAHGSEFAFGADLSFLKQAEDQGTVFKDGTNAVPGLLLFRNHGYNWVRLRLFVEPVGGKLPNDDAYTLAMATAAKKLGYKFLLDLHYANSWADPGKQPTPEHWKNLTHRQRVKAVFEYTRDTLTKFHNAGVPPDMVQIGNEITHGMLWPDGKLPEHWDNFADYLRAGVRGVDAACGKGPRPKIMIHIDQGASIPKTKYFFDKLNGYGIRYDVIGFSYYPCGMAAWRTCGRIWRLPPTVTARMSMWSRPRITGDRPGIFATRPRRSLKVPKASVIFWRQSRARLWMCRRGAAWACSGGNRPWPIAASAPADFLTRMEARCR